MLAKLADPPPEGAAGHMYLPGAPVAYAAVFGLLLLAWLMLFVLVTETAIQLFDAADERRGGRR